MPNLSIRFILAAWLAAALPAHALSFAALAERIDSERLRSVEAVVAALPPYYRARYALMFSSRSLHGASFDSPRVILYAPDARFVLTFNGDPRHTGYSAIETMEFEPATARFVFREILFPPPGVTDAKPTLSEPNPARCATCHGVPARPVWDTHPTWPGAYGESYRAALGHEESEGMRRFLAGRAQHPRYQLLADTERLADGETFRQSPGSLYTGAQREPANAELTALLAGLNVESIVREVRSQPRYDIWKYALLASTDDRCGSPDSLFPERDRAAARRAFARFAADTEHANDRQAELKRLRTLAPRRGGGAGYASPIGAEPLTAFRFLAEVGLDMSTGDWTLALEKPSYDFAAPGTTGNRLRNALLAALAAEDPGLADLGEERADAGSDRHCAWLARRSRQVLADLAPAPDLERIAAGRPRAAARAADSPPARPGIAPPVAAAACARCHENDVGPPLPFGRPAALASLLRGGRYPRGTLLDEILFRLSPQAGTERMPLGSVTGAAERAALAAYFRRLAASAEDTR